MCAEIVREPWLLGEILAMLTSVAALALALAPGLRAPAPGQQPVVMRRGARLAFPLMQADEAVEEAAPPAEAAVPEDAPPAPVVAAVAPPAASAGSNPAMYVMSEVELAEQSSKMDALAAKWRKRQQQAEVIEAQQVGWCPNAERINGRFAMFFLVTGLITEYYTGENVPAQVATIFRTLGVIE